MSRECLERIMMNLGAPNFFSEVQVTCPSCRKLHKIPGMDWMEWVDNGSIVIQCSCERFVGIVGKQDNIRFIAGQPDLAAHLPSDVQVVLVDSSPGTSGKKPWWKLW